jgi:hypothetical protein
MLDLVEDSKLRPTIEYSHKLVDIFCRLFVSYAGYIKKTIQARLKNHKKWEPIDYLEDRYLYSICSLVFEIKGSFLKYNIIIDYRTYKLHSWLNSLGFA